MNQPMPVFNEIREYRLQTTTARQAIEMPEFAEISSILWRGTRPSMFVKVDSTSPLRTRHFVGVRVTSTDPVAIPVDGTLRGTVTSAALTEGGNQIIAHIFEVPAPAA